MSHPPPTIIQAGEQPAVTFPWGAITWLCNEELDPAATMTFGLVQIMPGQKNALHYHPNCEEYLYVLSGACEHSLDGSVYSLGAGSLIRIPAGAPHDAVNRGTEPVVCVIVYSTPDRQTVIVEE